MNKSEEKKEKIPYLITEEQGKFLLETIASLVGRVFGHSGMVEFIDQYNSMSIEPNKKAKGAKLKEGIPDGEE